MNINKAYALFFTSAHRYAVLMGGAGSGKSVSAAQKLLLRITTEPGHRILVCRKVKATLRASVYQLLLDLITEYGLQKEFVASKTSMRFTHLPTGNQVLLAGLDDPEKIKSIAGITSVWCEEATELEERDFNQLELRVRGETKNYKQFVLTFNPIDEQHWLKKRFFEEPDEQVYTLRTTYKHNVFLDDDYKKHLEERIRNNENLYKVYALGQWGRATTGGEFYKNFRFGKHVQTVTYNPALPLHLSFDFNVNPYLTATIWQVQGRRAMQVDELCLSSPRNTTRHVCKEFLSKYNTHTSGLFVYGDPAGRHQDTRNGEGYNDFTIILSELAALRPTLRLSRSSPSVVMRGNFINAILDSNYAGIELVVGQRCGNTISDYTYLKEDSDGTKLKEKCRNPETGVVYEKYGHCSDANDYFICAAFAPAYQRYLRGNKPYQITVGKPLVSRNGY